MSFSSVVSWPVFHLSSSATESLKGEPTQLCQGEALGQTAGAGKGMMSPVFLGPAAALCPVQERWHWCYLPPELESHWAKVRAEHSRTKGFVSCSAPWHCSARVCRGFTWACGCFQGLMHSSLPYFWWSLVRSWILAQKWVSNEWQQDLYFWALLQTEARNMFPKW